MKRYQKLVAALSLSALLCGNSYAAAADVPAETESATPAATQTIAPDALTYSYESKTYGYRIMCPQKPVGVIPASALYDDREGEILIFDNEEYNIKYAWAVFVNAFSDTSVPNLNTINPEDAVNLLERIQHSNGYEGIMLINLSDTNKAIFAMTAKEVDIDEDGDGVVDATAKADNQTAVMFFRGANGQRYGLELIDNPTFRAKSVATFMAGARTMQ